MILPNNGNILMAASQAQALAAGEGKNVAVVPVQDASRRGSARCWRSTRTPTWSTTPRPWRPRSEHVQTGEVTVAVQNARFDGIDVAAGEIIGLLNDTLTAKGASPAEVVADLLEQMDAADLEVITLYYGEPVTAEEADALTRGAVRAVSRPGNRGCRGRSTVLSLHHLRRVNDGGFRSPRRRRLSRELRSPASIFALRFVK